MSEIKTNIGSDLNGDYRKDLNGNFIIIKATEGGLKKDVNTLKNDHTTILKKLAEVKELEEANAKRLDQQHLNMKQIVEVLQYFNTPVGWDGENIVIRKDI